MDKVFERVFWNLFNCSGEDEVSEVIKNDDLLNNDHNWQPYGEGKGNHATFVNQQSNAFAALVEKITNSIDSALLKECKHRGICPESKHAPQSLNKAVELFFSIKDGELGEISSSDRKKLSENIQVIAIGKKGADEKPDILVFDNAEGQHPKDFAETFLSIGKNNKNKIKFVQGKFNMGSTGAVVFCGKKKYQLIASKLDNKLFNNKKDIYSSNKFGFTLVRKHPFKKSDEAEYKSSWYEYFSVSKSIPSFEIDDVDLGLHEKKFRSGTIVKLFSYDIQKGYRGNFRGRPLHCLNQILYRPALPFMVKDNRYPSKKKGLEVFPVYGNHVRLGNDSSDMLESSPIFLQTDSEKMGKIGIKIFVFKVETTQENKENIRNYIGEYPVIFTLDGKVHGHLKNIFIRNELKLPLLQKSTLICIDCTEMRIGFREELFMGNRWILQEKEELKELKNKIIDLVKNDASLKKISEERKRRAVGEGGNERGAELIRNILSKNPMTDNLRYLMQKINGIPLPKSGKSDKKRGDKKSSGKTGTKSKNKSYCKTSRFPSIFNIKLKENDEGKKAKGIPLEGSGSIEFETDVNDDYFYRPNDKGEIEISILGHSRGKGIASEKGMPHRVDDLLEVDISGPSDGAIKVTFSPKSNLKVGDEIKINAKLSSPDEDLQVIFYIRIGKKAGEGKKTKSTKEPSVRLPALVEVGKKDGAWIDLKNGNNWSADDEEWGDDSVVYITENFSEEHEANIIISIAINLESNVLKRCLSKDGADTENKIQGTRQRYISQIYLHSLFLYNSIRQNNPKNNEIEITQLISNSFKQYGEAIMYLNFNEELMKYIE